MVCPSCTSHLVIKYGKKLRKSGTRQEYKCKVCARRFSIPVETVVSRKTDDIEPGKIFSEEFNDTIRIHGLTDIHVGAVEHDIAKFDEAIKVIKEDDNARWFANGDLLELIPPNYKINQRGQIYHLKTNIWNSLNEWVRYEISVYLFVVEIMIICVVSIY